MEILQDTIIKLIIRQGPNSDRQNIVLTSGEQGYTTDSKRVFVGDGIKFGGNLVGNLYKGDIAGLGSPATPTGSELGDLIFNTETRKLYRAVNPAVGNLTGWSQVGGVYVSGDNKINISDTNVITLCALSGGAFSPASVQYPIVLSGGKISLPPLSAGTVSNDLVNYPIVLSGGRISLPPLSAGTVSNNLVQYPIVLSAGKIALPPLSAGTVSTNLLLSPIILNGGQIALAPLSAGNVSSDLLISPLFLSAGRIAIALSSVAVALSSTATITVSTGLIGYANGVATTDPINPTTTNIIIKLSSLTALVAAASADLFDGPIVYNTSTGRISLSAKIPFERVSTNTITASSGLLSYVDGVKVTSGINPLSANIVLQSNQLFIRFEGATGTNTYSRGISGIRLGLGSYVFRYGPLPTANIYPFIQIHSLTSHRYTARTTSMNVSSLSVTIVQVDAVTPINFADVDMFLQINY